MDGILCLDKGEEMTSFLCCSLVRKLLKVKKAGHAGTLDPMATGVLPILVGRATRALDWLPVHDKRYTAEVQFGLTSDSLDIWGNCRETGAPLPSLAAVEAALPAFRGNILQIPPMLSALKRDGVRLYDMARQGLEVEREPRPVTIYALEILSYDETAGRLRLDCLCSKGTYIRTLCDDLGRALGCGAVMAGLRRTMAAGYGLEDCCTLEQARELAAAGRLESRLLSVESAFLSYPAVTVTAAQATRFCNGGALALERLREPVRGTVRVKAPDNGFLGLGVPEGDSLRVGYLAVTAGADG